MLWGGSDTGKSHNALQLAEALGSYCVVDAEHERIDDFWDKFNLGTKDIMYLDHVERLNPDFYMHAIGEAEESGVDSIVYDGLTFLWEGVLDKVDQKNAASTNPEVRSGWSGKDGGNYVLYEVLERMIRSPLNVIVTMRAKNKYESVLKKGRKKKSLEVTGLKPHFRDNAHFEWTIAGQLYKTPNGRRIMWDKTGPIQDLKDEPVDGMWVAHIHQWRKED